MYSSEQINLFSIGKLLVKWIRGGLKCHSRNQLSEVSKYIYLLKVISKGWTTIVLFPGQGSGKSWVPWSGSPLEDLQVFRKICENTFWGDGESDKGFAWWVLGALAFFSLELGLMLQIFWPFFLPGYTLPVIGQFKVCRRCCIFTIKFVFKTWSNTGYTVILSLITLPFNSPSLTCPGHFPSPQKASHSLTSYLVAAWKIMSERCYFARVAAAKKSMWILQIPTALS